MKNTIHKFVKVCVLSFKKCGGRNKPKWMNRRLELLIKKKQEASERYRGRKTENHHERFIIISARNIVTREVRAAKLAYEKRVAQDATRNTRHLWPMCDQEPLLRILQPG